MRPAFSHRQKERPGQPGQHGHASLSRPGVSGGSFSTSALYAQQGPPSVHRTSRSASQVSGSGASQAGAPRWPTCAAIRAGFVSPGPELFFRYQIPYNPYNP